MYTVDETGLVTGLMNVSFSSTAIVTQLSLGAILDASWDGSTRDDDIRVYSYHAYQRTILFLIVLVFLAIPCWFLLPESSLYGSVDGKDGRSALSEPLLDEECHDIQ